MIGLMNRISNGAKLKMTVPNHRERQLMQELRGTGWVRATALPSSPRTIEGLLKNVWIEQRGTGNDTSYRITDKGLAAKTEPVGLTNKHRGELRLKRN
jgi:hypothetical protein